MNFYNTKNNFQESNVMFISGEIIILAWNRKDRATNEIKQNEIPYII